MELDSDLCPLARTFFSIRLQQRNNKEYSNEGFALGNDGKRKFLDKEKERVQGQGSSVTRLNDGVSTAEWFVWLPSLFIVRNSD